MSGEMIPNYIRLMRSIHAHLRPNTYVEIGVSSGKSLSRVLPETDAVGIDPEPQRWAYRISCSLALFELTSDEFFEKRNLTEELGGRPVEIALSTGCTCSSTRYETS